MNWSALLARLLVGLVVLTPSLAPGQTTETDPRPAPVPVTPSARQTEPQVDVEPVDTEPVSVTSNGEPTEVKQDANPTSSAEEPAPDTYFIDLRDPPPVEEPPEDVKTNALTLDDTTDMIEESSGEAAPASDIPGLRLIRPAALGANREREPPRYVRSMAEHAKYFGLTGWDDLDWFDFGIEQRTRFEYRGNYYREDQETGRLTVMRSRVYLGMRDVLDPLRFAFEFEDARRFGDPIDDRSNINEASILQAYGELYFPDVGGPDHPLRVRFGRLSFDAIDRRLVARNRFRNTTNSFQGFRVTLGEQATDLAVFFTLAGMGLHFDQVALAGLAAAVYFLARLAGKLAGVGVAMRLASAPRKLRRLLGLALLPQAGLVVGQVLLLQDDPAFAGQTQALGLILTIVLTAVTANEIVGPLLTRLALARSGEVQKDRLRLMDFIQEQNILTGFHADSKEEAIRKLVAHMIRSQHLENVDHGELLASVLEREAQASTCLGGGLSIPHGILPDGHPMVGVLGISREGLPFETPDDRPIHCIVLLGTAATERDRHVQVLAMLARTIGMDPAFQDRLIEARTPAHAADILHGEETEAFNYFLDE